MLLSSLSLTSLAQANHSEVLGCYGANAPFGSNATAVGLDSFKIALIKGDDGETLYNSIRANKSMGRNSLRLSGGGDCQFQKRGGTYGTYKCNVDDYNGHFFLLTHPQDPWAVLEVRADIILNSRITIKRGLVNLLKLKKSECARL